jgi:pilus assembly protein CpaF
MKTEIRMHKFVIDRIEDDKIIYDDIRKKAGGISAYIRQYCRIYEATIDQNLSVIRKHLLSRNCWFWSFANLLDDQVSMTFLINGPQYLCRRTRWRA